MKTAKFAFAAVAALTLVQPSIAQAEPFDGPLIATTCSYAQLHSALQFEAPKLAAELDARPAAQDKLQKFIALPVDQRKQKLTEALDRNPEWQAKLDEKRATPEGQQQLETLRRVAQTCGSY
jgi:hemophore-related protein